MKKLLFALTLIAMSSPAFASLESQMSYLLEDLSYDWVNERDNGYVVRMQKISDESVLIKYCNRQYYFENDHKCLYNNAQVAKYKVMEDCFFIPGCANILNVCYQIAAGGLRLIERNNAVHPNLNYPSTTNVFKRFEVEYNR